MMFIVLLNALGNCVPSFASIHTSESQFISSEGSSEEKSISEASNHSSSKDQDCENESCLDHRCHLGHCSFVIGHLAQWIFKQLAEAFLSFEEMLLFSVILPASGKPPKSR